MTASQHLMDSPSASCNSSLFYTDSSSSSCWDREGGVWGEGADPAFPVCGDPPLDLFVVNVGGSRFLLSAQMLASFPHTRLGRLAFSRASAPELCDDYRENEFFFDRNYQTFQYVLNFYRTGHLHVREELCELSFLQEIQYWGLDELRIEACCRERYYRRKDLRDSLNPGLNPGLDQDLDRDQEDFEGAVLSDLRRRLWEVLEKPESSGAARIFGTLSIFFVVLSVVNMVLISLDLGESELGADLGVSSLLDALEYVCVFWFSAELLVRFLCVRDKCRFSRRVVNVIDLLAVLPFYVTLAVESVHGTSSDIQHMGRTVQVLRLLRSLRMLKLGRHLTGLKSLGLTIAQCYEEVGLLLLFLGVGISIFSTMVFSLEHDVPGSTFVSVPAAWWWATTSMTTVGYGDVRPDTALGKGLAFLCILSGILILALPIAIINERFSYCYLTLKVKEAAVRHSEMLKRLARGSVGGAEAGSGARGAGLNLRDVYASNVLEMIRLRGRERASTRSSAADTNIWW